ncbi:MAG: tetratricopeptide repeat protein, partial [Cyanobacteria bacterium P01_D01_bin.73]
MPNSNTPQGHSKGHEEWFEEGYGLSQDQRYGEAIVCYDEAIKLKSDYYAAWMNRGNVCLQLGRYEDSVMSFDRALEIQQTCKHALNNRRFVCRKKAAELFASFAEGTAAYTDEDPESGYIQALIHEARGDFREAIAHCDDAISVKPDYARAWYERANSLYELKRYEEAAIAYDKTAQFNPKNNEARYRRSNTLRLL